ncbi:MAG TPA: hypothetical protein VNP72_00070 [Longimicrobium sp.]|nr:hypothetical protein [Longimicrobium sp.]
MSAPTTAAPDLSHLPVDVRLGIAVARALGWSGVICGPRTNLSASAPAYGYPPLYRRSGARSTVPDYLNDPAAWGALMEKERIDVLAPCVGGRQDWVAQAADKASMHGHFAATPGRAVALAVLAKHGVDTAPYTEGET